MAAERGAGAPKTRRGREWSGREEEWMGEREQSRGEGPGRWSGTVAGGGWTRTSQGPVEPRDQVSLGVMVVVVVEGGGW